MSSTQQAINEEQWTDNLRNELTRLRAEVERLTAEYADLKRCHDEHYRDMLALSVENERLRVVLRYYADPNHWSTYALPGPITLVTWLGTNPPGKRASAALADTSRDKTADTRGDE